ncbi:MAG: TadE/TadG family type IV pilus assembly protein [Pseudomonadota bacterium]
MSFFRFRRDEDGAAAIEFSLLAIPFFLLIFAIIETCLTFGAEQTLNFAVDKLGRELRTGQITFAAGEGTDITEEEFRTRLCDEIAIFFSCGDDADERLFLDLQSYATFADIPTDVPVSGGELDDSAFAFSPGGAATINMLRVYYIRNIAIDMFRPYLANIKKSGGSQTDHYLIVATTAYRNENY